VNSRGAVIGSLCVALLSAISTSGAISGEDALTVARRELLAQIEQDVRDTAQYLNKRALDERVMRALSKVPRHEFVPADLRAEAMRTVPSHRPRPDDIATLHRRHHDGIWSSQSRLPGARG
jgi:protein-L-isoaspartate(D-aspartate) O-methyltransferase